MTGRPLSLATVFLASFTFLGSPAFAAKPTKTSRAASPLPATEGPAAIAPAKPGFPPNWTDADRKAVSSGELFPGWDLLSSDGPTSDPVPSAPADPSPAEQPVSKEVPERFLEAYFAAKPQSFLIDPQGLLDPHIAKDREAFLRYHAEDSKIDLYVYLFAAGQEIPGAVRSEEIAERFYAEGKPAVVVYYFLGAPERSEIRVSPVLGDSVSGAEQRRALSTSLAQALEKQDPIAQLEAFCVQMSIRLYWMESAAGLSPRPVPDALVFETRHTETADAPPSHAELKKTLLALVQRWWIPATLAIGGSLAVAFTAWIWQSRRRYRFPEFDIPARIGGAYGAGIGAVISFGSSTQSPSTQRRDVPDYLGGL